MLRLFTELHSTIKTFLQEEIGQEVMEFTVIFALATIIVFATVSTLSEQIDSLTDVLLTYF